MMTRVERSSIAVFIQTLPGEFVEAGCRKTTVDAIFECGNVPIVKLLVKLFFVVCIACPTSGMCSDRIEIGRNILIEKAPKGTVVVRNTDPNYPKYLVNKMRISKFKMAQTIFFSNGNIYLLDKAGQVWKFDKSRFSFNLNRALIVLRGTALVLALVEATPPYSWSGFQSDLGTYFLAAISVGAVFYYRVIRAPVATLSGPSIGGANYFSNLVADNVQNVRELQNGQFELEYTSGQNRLLSAVDSSRNGGNCGDLLRAQLFE